MLKNTNKYQTLLAVCLLTLSACSTNETLTDSPIDQSKTPIELTAGIIGENAATPRAQTRTVITNDSPYGSAAKAFEGNTNLYMVLKSEYGGTGASQSPLYSRSMGSVTGSTAAYNEVTFGDGYKHYWEDSYSRDSKLSVYSACVPGNTSTALNIASSTTYNNNTWSTTAITPTIVWPLEGSSASQNADFLNAQDLCFSNNVSGDNHIYFATSAKKFTPKEMFFHHALTKVTFKIKKGNGFESASFAFTSPGGENIVLKGFNSSGTLDISTGEFGSIGTTDITSLADTKTSDDETAGYTYVLTGLMLPGSVLTSTATNEVYFTIDENKYHITKSQLATALNGKTVGSNSTPALTTDSKMRPGVHYVFTMTVSKSQISNLSAAVVGWETVTAEEVVPSNARISVSLLNNGTPETSTNPTFDLFRSENVNTGDIDDGFTSFAWATGYEKAYLQKSESAYAAYEENNHSTPWYWPNNKTFYHFRTLKPQTTDMWKVLTDNTDSSNPFDYVTLEGAAANSYRDVCWGAPFNDDATPITYDPTTNGFNGTGTYQISRAIGPTTSTINMNTFHMMSDVTINLTTTDGTDAVTLSGAMVKLTPVYNTGTVRMGNGLINTTGSTGDITGTVSDVDGQSYKQWRYGFVPQSLESVVLTITTTDHNQYIVNMKDVVAYTVSSNIISDPYTDNDNKINRWYPNFSYTYTFHLTKTGIEKVTATLAAWGAVTADPQTVVIQ